jgi:purine-binding chemotaxis protein CheW
MTDAEAGRSAGAREMHAGDLACFEVGGHVFALDVRQIREIVRWHDVTPLPRAPLLIEGVVDLRDAVVPVVDLGRALGGEPVQESAHARIVVLESDGLLLGLRVDRAVDVLAVEGLAVEPPPALAMQAGYDVVRAVVRRPSAPPVLVLSLAHLLDNVHRSALPSADRAEGGPAARPGAGEAR